VDTLPTVIDEAVMPVWLLKALDGTVLVEPVEVVFPTAVVAVLAELVELQATAVVATSPTTPSAAKRVFHDAEPKAPPCFQLAEAARAGRTPGQHE
jgi:hypothetical protein